MKFGLEPIDHIPPYRRIGINEMAKRDAGMTAGEAIDRIDLTLRRLEAARIWALVQQAAGGSNLPTQEAVEA